MIRQGIKVTQRVCKEECKLMKKNIALVKAVGDYQLETSTPVVEST